MAHHQAKSSGCKAKTKTESEYSGKPTIDFEPRESATANEDSLQYRHEFPEAKQSCPIADGSRANMHRA